MRSPEPDAYAGVTFCEVCGRENCEGHDTRPATSALTAVPARDLITWPRPTAILEGMAWSDRLTVLPAESGTGKTFVLLDLAAAVSDDVKWHGREVEHGSVVYVSFEGDAIGLRLWALQEHSGRRMQHLYVIRAADPLSPKVTHEGELASLGEAMLVTTLATLRDELQTSGRPGIKLLVVDTVRASMTGSEDSSEHVSAYLRAVRRVMTAVPGAACMLAHHTGWQDGDQQRKRERGSSAFRGNCDATIYLEAGEYDADRGEALLTLRALKVRDDERPAPLRLIRRRVELPEMDRHGQPVTSCIIERDRRTPEAVEAARVEAEATLNRKTDLQLLRAIENHHVTSVDSLRAFVGLARPVVQAGLARMLSAEWVLSPERQRQPFVLSDAGRTVLTATSF